MLADGSWATVALGSDARMIVRPKSAPLSACHPAGGRTITVPARFGLQPGRTL